MLSLIEERNHRFYNLSLCTASSGLEAESVRTEVDLANHMGLFLQKVNIIRDYLVRKLVRFVFIII